MKKILILVIVFYILVLFQISFLVHFNIFDGSFLGWSPNLILIAVILLNIFENPQKNSGYFTAFIGGFFLDIFSCHFLGINFIGFWISILLAISFSIKFILRKYVRTSVFSRI